MLASTLTLSLLLSVHAAFPVAAARAVALTLPRPTAGAEDEKQQAGAAPHVVSLEPAHLSAEVDAKKTTKIVATFDRPMDNTGWSFCGNGVPEFKGRPRWDTPTKIVVDVVLEPDHEYRFSLNCGATNFKSLEGVPLVPVTWSFTTAPAKLLSPAKQKAENKKSFEALQALLAQSYSHFDLRVPSWDKLYDEHQAEILAAKTKSGWAAAVARMLTATEDIHLHLRIGERLFATGKRAVDPLYRKENLARHVQVMPVGARCLLGRTEDGIGYVMIGEWSDAKDVDALEQALATLRDAKAIVLDVRPNSGGNELLAQRVAAWFVEGTKVYAKNRYRVKAGDDGFGPVLERSLTGNSDPSRRIVKPVAVLTSRYVMSSNESFVLMMKQAPDCTVVGQPTYGSSANPKPHDLPNGVTVVLPSWQDLRLDGTCFEGEGLAPDVLVEVDPRELEKNDPILERALAILRAKIESAAKPGG